MPALRLALLLLLFAGCKAPQKTAGLSAPPEAQQAPSISPNTCVIRGQIITILRIPDPDKSSPCATHPCQARVKILEVGTCGPGAATPMLAGDTAVFRFVCTLDATDKVVPQYQGTHYPGLSAGSIFRAAVQQALRPGGGATYTVWGYEKIR